MDEVEAKLLEIYHSPNVLLGIRAEEERQLIQQFRTLVEAGKRPKVWCRYTGVLFRLVPKYIEGYGCPVCKGLRYHLPI